MKTKEVKKYRCPKRFNKGVRELMALIEEQYDGDEIIGFLD